MTNDSIQTLLKQRRELRECLQELRNEVTAMHQNTNKMVENVLGENQPVSKPKREVVTSATQTTLPDPATALKLIQQISRDKKAVSDSASLVAEPILPTKTAPLDAGDKTPGPGAEKELAEGSEPPLDAEDIPRAPLPQLNSKSENQTEQGREKREDDEAPEIDSLLNHAILLADFFLHHPSSAGNEQLGKLDAAISQIQRLPATNKSDAAVTALKNAYRTVVSATYSQSKVNGKSISDSSTPISLLWALPLVISSLVLVVLPCLLLVRSLVQRMFVDDFSSELMLSIGGAAAFIWAACGALVCVAFLMALEAKNKRYVRDSNRDIAVRAVVGGVLGLGVFLVFSIAGILVGLERDMAVGMIAFLVGGASSLVVGFLEKRVARRKSMEKLA